MASRETFQSLLLGLNASQLGIAVVLFRDNLPCHHKTMRRFAPCAFVIVLLLGAGVQQGLGQRIQAEVGPRVGIDRLGLRQFLGIDVHVPIPTGELPIVANPTFGYYFSADTSIDIAGTGLRNINSVYNFGVNGLVNATEWGSDRRDNPFFNAYVGVGIVFSRISYGVPSRFEGSRGSIDNTETVPSVNLIAGAKFSEDSFLSPFLQARTTIDSEISSPATSFLALSFGLLVGP
jgi:hypothetical protein